MNGRKVFVQEGECEEGAGGAVNEIAPEKCCELADLQCDKVASRDGPNEYTGGECDPMTPDCSACTLTFFPTTEYLDGEKIIRTETGEVEMNEAAAGRDFCCSVGIETMSANLILGACSQVEVLDSQLEYTEFGECIERGFE